ncbi:MAG: hypothetical protein AAFQ80_03495 [Cyanobacteria bacterium J06621_8]
MKVRYLGTLLATSVLSLGLVTSCATPDQGGVDAGGESTEINPCAGAADPCAGAVDPCAGAADPCAGAVDPCAGAADPCAGK